MKVFLCDAVVLLQGDVVSVVGSFSTFLQAAFAPFLSGGVILSC